jgi:hypothetical protein
MRIFLAILAVPALLLAQLGSEGTILGLVKDATGAVVPGAGVTITNLNTGLTRSATAGATGNFEALGLPIGPYSVGVAATGFKTWKLVKTDLLVGERKRVEITLEIGALAEQVSVTSAVELVQTDKTAVEGIIEEKQIRDLPLNGRNPVQLASLAPGMRFLGRSGYELGSSVQGLGNRADATQYQVDGLNANSGMDEKGMGISNVDTIAEFNMETSSFSAEHGRDPMQLIVVTKSGTNQFHGTAWEFIRNDVLDARNAFAVSVPKLRRNQYGATVGGPVIRNRTFFFGSFEGTNIRTDKIYNSTVVSPAMLDGNFSGLKAITDPIGGKPFPNNQIPISRFSTASKFFFPYILLPNYSDGRYRTIASTPDDMREYTVRADHLITDRHRVSVRWIKTHDLNDVPQYKPDVLQNRDTAQHNVGLNYNYAVTPATLVTIGAGYLRSNAGLLSAMAGKENLTQKAGIQGFPTEGREEVIGLPTISFTGYTGPGLPLFTPGRFWMEAWGGKASISHVRGTHSFSAGYELDNRRVLARHASSNARGGFTFNAQYTGDGFADYLLGDVASSLRNYPLDTFGQSSAPYSGLYAQDSWKAARDLTINFGVRVDYWHSRSFVRGAGATFDPGLGKAIAAENKSGQVDLTAQPVAKNLAAAMKDLWIPASQAKIPAGLFEPNGRVSPRLGAAWRPLGSNQLVIRGGFGIFASYLRGNMFASSVAGVPYWSLEAITFARTQIQPWETAWPADPKAYTTPSVQAPVWNTESMRAKEWNFAIQKSLPLQSALTVSYVGNRATGLITQNEHNAAPPAKYTNLQAALPWPAFGNIRLLENIGRSSYDGLQAKLERRFARGFSYMLSYAFSKQLGEAAGSDSDLPIPFAPQGYNRGRSDLDRTHILSANGLYELPFGRKRRFASGIPAVADAVLGGWQLSAIYQFISGSPLSFTVSGATLGNGYNTRGNLIGDPHLANPSVSRWFDPAAFQAPPLYAFGNSGMGIMDGPGVHSLDLGLLKDLHLTESKYLQFRAEAFNSTNHVNLSNPNTTLGQSSTAQITSAGSARQMQLGLKFIF